MVARSRRPEPLRGGRRGAPPATRRLGAGVVLAVLVFAVGAGLFAVHRVEAEVLALRAQALREHRGLTRSRLAGAILRANTPPGLPGLWAHLRELAGDPDPALRRVVARLAVRAPAADTLPVLQKLAADPDAEVRALALAALPTANPQGIEPLLVRALGDPSAAVRTAALAKLRSRRVSNKTWAPETLSKVVERLGDADSSVQARAFELLSTLWGQAEPFPAGALGDRVVARLAPLARRPSPQMALVRLLGASGRSAAVAPLVEIARRADAKGKGMVSFAAIQAIRRLGGPRVVAPLAGLLHDALSRNTRQWVNSSLLEVGTPEALSALAKNLSRTANVGSTLRLLSRSGRSDLLALAVANYDALDQDGRISFLGAVRDAPHIQGAAGVIAKGLKEPSPRVVRAALSAAWSSWTPSLLPLVVRALKSPDRDVRVESLRLIRREAGGDATALRAVVPLLADPDESVAQLAGRLLREKGGAEEVDLVFGEIERLAHPGSAFEFLAKAARPVDWKRVAALLTLERPDLRRRALGLLGSLHAPASRASIERKLTSDDPAVREAAVRALAAVAGADALGPLRAALGDPTTRQAARDALVTIRDRRVVPVLLEMLARRPSKTLLQALAKLADPRAVGPIVADALRTSPRMGVRKGETTALWALSSLPVKPAVAGLRRVLDAESGRVDAKVEAVQALARINAPEVRPLLLAQTKAHSSDVRRTAVEALGRFVDLAVVPALVERLTDPALSVRASAKSALDRVRYVLEQRRFAAELTAKAGPPRAARPLHVVPLRHARAKDLAATLARLGLDATISPHPQTNALVIAAEPEVYRALLDVIGKLDTLAGKE